MLADFGRMLRTIRKRSTRSALRSANGGDVDIDSLNILGLDESPAKLEAVITEQQSLAQGDDSVGALLASIYLRADRAGDFARFLGSRDFEVTCKLLELFEVRRNDRICEVGGGPGFLTWALAQRGFTDVELLEPSNC